MESHERLRRGPKKLRGEGLEKKRWRKLYLISINYIYKMKKIIFYIYKKF